MGEQDVNRSSSAAEHAGLLPEDDVLEGRCEWLECIEDFFELLKTRGVLQRARTETVEFVRVVHPSSHACVHACAHARQQMVLRGRLLSPVG